MDKHDFYIEFWNVGDQVKVPEPSTFSLHPTSLKYFLKRFINGADKRTIVYLRDTTSNKVLVDRRNLS